MGNDGVYIPRRLDDQWKLGMWDIDVALPTLIGIVLGIAKGSFSAFFICALLGLLVSWKVSKIKASQHPGYAMHVMYWFAPGLGFVNRYKRVPESAFREMVG